MNHLSNERGAVQILVALALTALLGSAALVVDVGVAMTKRISLSNGLDAAALAGGADLPGNPTKAVATAKQYLTANGINLNDVTITLTNSNTKMTLLGKETLNTMFAKALGVSTTTVEADSAIMVGAVTSVTGGGLRPLTIPDQPLVYGQQVVLKEAAGGATAGNFNAVDLDDGRGA